MFAGLLGVQRVIQRQLAQHAVEVDDVARPRLVCLKGRLEERAVDEVRRGPGDGQGIRIPRRVPLHGKR